MKIRILVFFMFISMISTISFAGDITSKANFVNDDYKALEEMDLNDTDKEDTIESTLMSENDMDMMKEDEPMEEETGAHKGFYAGGGLSLIAVETKDKANFFKKSDDQDRQIGLNLLVGYNFIDYLAVEGRILFGIAKAKATKMQNFALFLKPNIDVIENLNIYGLLGFASSNLAQSDMTKKVSGVSWGAGLSYNLKDFVGHNILVYSDILNLLHKKDTHSMAGFNLGAIYQF